MRFSKSLLTDINHYNVRNSTQSWLKSFNKYNSLNFINSSFFIFFSYNKKINNKFIQKLLKEASITYGNMYIKPISIKKNIEFFNKIKKKEYKHLFKTKTRISSSKYYKLKKTPIIFTYRSDLLWNLFDIYFLRKERTYTKLKYSRVPQYDIVSGGVAAIFAGFLGFLICEKFGVELVDSGDFYIVFMYIVFLAFFFKLLLNIMDIEELTWGFYSYKWLVFFYYQIIVLSFNKFYELFKKSLIFLSSY